VARALLAVLVAASLCSGCYLSHEVADVDAVSPSDAGVTCPVPDASVSRVVGTSPHTIDSVSSAWTAEYRPVNGVQVTSFAPTYHLDDGTSWEAGQYSAAMALMQLRSIEPRGTTLRYHMVIDGPRLWEQTDGDHGEHAANFRLDQGSELVLEATRGSQTATLDAYVRVAADEPATVRDARFHYLSAPLCAEVHVTAHYQLISGVFDESTFDARFEYSAEAVIDFRMVHP
jgi:hypothetical protein